MALDLRSGRIAEGTPDFGERMGNLLPHRELVLSQSYHGTSRVLELEGLREPPRRMPLRNVPGIPILLRWRNSLISNGLRAIRPSAVAHFQAALALCDKPSIRRDLFNSLLAELDAQPQDADSPIGHAKPLIENAEKRIAGFRQAARATVRQGDRQGRKVLLPVAGAGPGRNARRCAFSMFRVRDDRGIEGEIADLLSSASPGERELLQQLFEQELQAARESRDPFALQRFAERFGQLRDGQRVPASLLCRTIMPGRPPLQFRTDPAGALREIGPSPGLLRGEATRGTFRRSRFFDEPAARYYALLRDSSGDVPCEGDVPVRNFGQAARRISGGQQSSSRVRKIVGRAAACGRSTHARQRQLQLHSD